MRGEYKRLVGPICITTTDSQSQLQFVHVFLSDSWHIHLISYWNRAIYLHKNNGKIYSVANLEFHWYHCTFPSITDSFTILFYDMQRGAKLSYFSQKINIMKVRVIYG